jgi:hypothetical protein
VSATEVDGLIVVPDCRLALWSLNGRAFGGTYVNFEALDEDEVNVWRNGTQHICEHCGGAFATAQALGSHRQTHDAPKSTGNDPEAGIRPGLARAPQRR